MMFLFDDFEELEMRVEADKLIYEQEEERLLKNNKVIQHISWYDNIPDEWVVIAESKKDCILLFYR